KILRSVEAASTPHHRSPISAIRPAGQDLGAPSAPGIDDTTAPIAAECQSFLDNVIAQCGRTSAWNDQADRRAAVEHQTTNLGGQEFESLRARQQFQQAMRGARLQAASS